MATNMTRRRFLGLSGGLLAAFGVAGCSGGQREGSVTADNGSTQAGSLSGVTPTTTVGEVRNDARTGDWGRMLFPITFDVPGDDVPLSRVGDYLPWYHYIDTDTTVAIVRDVLARAGEGRTVFIPIYSEEEMAATDNEQVGYRKRDTGLFFFPAQGLAEGDRAPFAIVNAGGGFAYVGSMQDSFPHCLWLSQHGINAFAMQYRPDAQLACEDLARGISYVFAHADELGVDTDGYSLWGGSAGGRMAAYLGSYGPAAFGGNDLPRPAACIVNYTGHSDYTTSDPATFSAVGERDGIASWRRMRSRLEAMSAAGIPTEFHHYAGLPHGFGLGLGTVAEGWIDQAVAFWMANR